MNKVLYSTAILFSLLVVVRSSYATSYTITDLGTLGGNYSCANAINNSGVVVGCSAVASGTLHAFQYDGVMHDITPTSTTTRTEAVGINNLGVVVGRSISIDSGNIVIVFSSGFYFDGTLNYLPGDFGSYCWPSDLNDSGIIVGCDGTSGLVMNVHPFSYDGTMHDLTTQIGKDTGIDAVNNIGVIAGSVKSNDTYRAFFYDGTMHELGTLADGQDSEATGINDYGVVIGTSDVSTGRHAFLYDGTMHDLGTLGGSISTSSGINNCGTVVGSSFLADDTSHAFLYDGMMHDLNDFLPDGSGWILKHAKDINDRGQIVGSGLIGGESHAFLMTPIPEPSTPALLGISVIILLGVWKRHRTAQHVVG